MRIDAHHHFWQLSRFEYPWMGPELRPIARDFGPADLQPLLDAQGIDCTLLVQTIRSLDETRWFLKLADSLPFVAGVIGWVDLTSPELDATLDELTAYPRLVGIRHQVHDEPDDAWLLRPDVVRGFSRLATRGLAYDLLVRPRHLPAALEVARACGELTFVVDHVAKPDIAHRGWDDWARPLAELAALPNVHCKLSGMITEADWHAWRPADLRPYIDHALDCFGPSRLMFGSDWPVCLLAGDYSQVMSALKENLAELSESEQSAIFGTTAERVYRLE